MRDMPIADVVLPPTPRAYRGVNWDGLGALYIREVRRFWKVGLQTLAAPIVTALLYMMVFVVAVGGSRNVGGVPFGAFIAPGLIMMQILNNAFANSNSSSLLAGQMNGLIGDFLTPPLSPGELGGGLRAGGAHPRRAGGRGGGGGDLAVLALRLRPALGDLLLRHRRGADHGPLGCDGGDLVGEVRPHLGGDQFHRDADDVPARAPSTW